MFTSIFGTIRFLLTVTEVNYCTKNESIKNKLDFICWKIIYKNTP